MTKAPHVTTPNKTTETWITRLSAVLTTIDAMSPKEQADVLVLLKARYPAVWSAVSGQE